MRSSLTRLFAKLAVVARRAHADEEGSSMVFGALTLFTLALFTVMVWVVGMNSSDHMQNQTAADSAAYSGALVEAECLESIAFLNDGMSFVYYTELRYAIDAIVYSTLKVFEEHDLWVQQNHSERLVDNVSGPCIPLGVDPVAANNPGAHANASYSPGLEPGGGGPYDAGFVMMGSAGGGNESRFFDARFQHARSRAQTLLPQGKRWLADIHFAERCILDATPALVKKTCIKIALDNGAEWVAVSSDLDQVFALDSDAPSNPPKTPGFTDNAQTRGMDPQLTRRYEDHKANPIDGVPRHVPQWFDDVLGTKKLGTSGYSQTRLCWNKRDWDHTQPAPKGQAPFAGAYDGQHVLGRGAPGPSGHWHEIHDHQTNLLVNGQVIDLDDDIFGHPAGNHTHDYGHGIDSGPDQIQHVVDDNGKAIPSQLPPGLAGYEVDIDLLLPGTPDHHAAQTCPTCDGQGTNYGEVTHTQDEAEQWLLPQFVANPRSVTEVTFNGAGEVQPRPIFMNKLALRAGVTVATWRHSRGLSNAYFPANPSGDLAVASAQIGLRDPYSGRIAVVQDVNAKEATFVGVNAPTVKIAIEEDDARPDNLFLGDPNSKDNPGLRFGARLVPVARDNTWAGGTAAPGGAASAGLQDLLYGKRWWNNVPANPGAGNAPTGDLQNALNALRASWVNVPQKVGSLTQ